MHWYSGASTDLLGAPAFSFSLQDSLMLGGRRSLSAESFLFLHFSKKILQKYIFGFTVLYPYRPAGGRQGAYRPTGRR